MQRFDHFIILAAESSNLAKVSQYISNRVRSLPSSNHARVIELRRLVSSIVIVKTLCLGMVRPRSKFLLPHFGNSLETATMFLLGQRQCGTGWQCQNARLLFDEL